MPWQQDSALSLDEATLWHQEGALSPEEATPRLMSAYTRVCSFTLFFIYFQIFISWY
jgi:hypothetical protein